MRARTAFILLLLVGVGCSSSKHPDYVEAGNPRPGTGGTKTSNSSSAAGAAGAEDAAGGASGGAADGNAGETSAAGNSGNPSGVAGVFDPTHVYLGFSPKKHVGYVWFDLEKPDTWTYGQTAAADGRLLAGSLVYSLGVPGPLNTFYVDEPDAAGTYEDNDVVVATEPCPMSIWGFRTSPDGHLIYTCADTGNVWYEDGTKVSEGLPLEAFGNDGLLLFRGPFALKKIGDAQATEVSGLPDTLSANSVAVRGTTNGFHLVTEDQISHEIALWGVDKSGAAQKLGVYPGAEAPRYHAALGPDDVLYTMHYPDMDVLDVYRYEPGKAGTAVLEVNQATSPFSIGVVDRDGLLTGP